MRAPVAVALALVAALMGGLAACDSGNEAPMGVDRISDQTVGVGETKGVYLSRYFTDPDGDTLTYSASLSASGVVTVSVSGDSLTVAGLNALNALDPVYAYARATDPDGEEAVQRFQVTVAPGLTRLTNHAAEDSNPVWSPDGEKIAFVSERDRKWVIYVMDADGSNLRRLTDGHHPAWSPDGRRIAFDGISVVDADGRNVTRLTDGRHPAWSPDGKKIAFESDRNGNYGIYAMDSDGSNLRRLTDGRHPAWSPDGTKIAFESDRDFGHDIYVMDADGTNVTRLTDSGGQYFEPAWSPDGTKIAVNRGRSIYIMDADGSDETRLTDGHHPAWSPDGTRIAVSHGLEIYVAQIIRN